MLLKRTYRSAGNFQNQKKKLSEGAVTNKSPNQHLFYGSFGERPK